MEKMSKVRYQDWPSSNDTEEKRWSKDGVKMNVWKYPVLTCGLNLRTFPKN